MGSTVEICGPSNTTDAPAFSIHDQIRQILVAAAAATGSGAAAGAVLKQFEDEASAHPLLCTMTIRRQHGAAQQMPEYDTIGWHGQAMASLAAAMVLESQASDLVAAANQLLQMFLPGYRRNQLQQSRRSMGVFLRSLKFCVTSEGQQAVLAAIICLVALQIFVDSAAALQAITREAVSSLGKKNRSSSGQLAAWAVTNVVHSSQADCNTIASSGGTEVLVDQLSVLAPKALAGLGLMLEQHTSLLWQCLLKFSGLAKVVEYTKNMDLQGEEGLIMLGSIIAGIHKLLEHPHNQAAVLQELKSSEVLDLLFICAKSDVGQVSKSALDCLVLIWQWYLRRSPSASFSLTQMSCFIPEGAAATAGHSPAAAVGAPSRNGPGPASAVASAGSPRPDTSQLWSIAPVVDFAFDRAASSNRCLQKPPISRASAAQQELQCVSNPANIIRSNADLPPKHSHSRATPARAPPPPSPGMVRVSSGSLPPFSQKSKTASDLLEPSSSASGQSGSGSGTAALDRASDPAVSPLLAFAKQRISPSKHVAEAKAASVSPPGTGQYMSLPATRLSSSTSASAPGLLNEDNLRAADQITRGYSKADPDVARDSDWGAPANLSRKSAEQQSVFTSSAGSVGSSASSSLFQQARRHSMSSPDSCRSFSSLYSPFSFRHLHRKPSPLGPDQERQMHRHAADASQSSSSIPASADISLPADIGVTTALDYALPEGNGSQLSQAKPLPPIRTSSLQPTEHRQPEGLQYIQSWLDTDPKGHWQPLAQSSPLRAKAEGLERQQSQRLERQSPAQLPSTPESKQPRQRVLQFSPMSVTQPGAEVLHSKSLGNSQSLQDAYLAKRPLVRGPAPLHEDSAWGSFDPQTAWSASASSLVTTPRLGSRASFSAHAPTEDRSVASDVSAARAIADGSDDLFSSRNDQNGQGKETKLSKVLQWLTDPDIRDARRAKKKGPPANHDQGAFIDSANPH